MWELCFKAGKVNEGWLERPASISFQWSILVEIDSRKKNILMSFIEDRHIKCYISMLILTQYVPRYI